MFALGYATSKFGVSRPTMPWAGALANATALVTQPLWAMLADRKPVFIGGVLGCAAMLFPYFIAITTGNTASIIAASIVLSGLIYTAPNAIWPSFYAEMFETRVRYSGTAIGTLLGFLGAGFCARHQPKPARRRPQWLDPGRGFRRRLLRRLGIGRLIDDLGRRIQKA